MIKIRLLLIFILVFNSFFSQSIRINEVSASNSIFLDEDGDTPDWIELYNYGASEISLNNWSLTDILDDSNPWTFPNITIDADEYLLIWASDKDRSGITYARTLVNEGDAYRYQIPNADTDLSWIYPDFDDNEWSIGNSGFGYADGDDNTFVTPGTVSVFLRKPFNIQNINEINSLILDVDYDDGFVAYINGIEVARANINGTPPLYNTTTQIDHEAQMYSGGNPDRFLINDHQDILINGENIFSIQVHNISDTSSDMTIIPFLSAIYNTDTDEGVAPPDILGLQSESFLHTDFKLSSSGETVFLNDALGNLVDSITFGALPSNISYGVSFENEVYVAYQDPSPGDENNSDEYSGVLGVPLTFSHDGGNITGSIDLEIFGDGTEDIITYTTDFTEPNENSILYNGPISIEETTVVRAKAFKENYISLHSNTRNYFFNTYTNTNHPIIHLVTDEYNLFDYNYGIYSYGPEDYGGYPFFGANFWEDWERPVHISYYIDNTLEFSANAGIKIAGAYSRGWDQKSLALFARGQYGVGKFEYPFFDNLDYESFESLVLRNSGNDWMRTNMRDAAITSLMEGSHIDFQSFKTVSSYINETYWGLYNLREKVSENMIASKHDVNPNDITMLEFDGEIVDGDNSEYLELRSYIQQNDLSVDENYNYVINQIDIDNYMEYHIAQIYMDNRDYPGNNVKYWKIPGGKWRWVLYDTDFGFAGQWWSEWDQNYAHFFDTLDFVLSGNQTTWANPQWATLFIRKLIENTGFRNKFINRYADEMNTRYLPTNVTSHFIDIYENMYDEMSNHIQRWNESEPWVSEESVYQFVDNMNNFATNRQPEAKFHILNQFDLDSYHELVLFNETPQLGYIFLNNNLTIQDDEWSGDYFEDVPITLKAIAESASEFSHWSGDINSTESEIEVNVTGNFEIEAHFINSSELNLVINEINYKSSDNFDTGDWVELYNPNEDDIDISGWVLKDNNDSNEFIFPANTIIAGNDYLVILRNIENFTQFHPEINPYVGEFNFGLSSSGDAVRLFNSDLILHDEVYYGSSSPWPPLSDGDGYTLELIDPSLDNSLPSSWSNINYHGSPNAINSVTASINDEDLLYTRVYPNPFIQTLNILLELEIGEFVNIDIFDLQGMLVNNIHSGILNPGMQKINKDLGKLNTGLYILKISTASGFNQTKKIIKF
ncbi:MAG: hypothetical protein CMC36_05180 [Flavobacteriaceae bacterium]|nr:hypothetical protein [Flavobacteriaceae bacterium]